MLHTLHNPRYLMNFDTEQMPCRRSDFLVIGAGVAGLRAAIEAAQSGSVTLLVKSGVHESNSYYAQGGIASACGESDSPETHMHDTLEAGKGLCDPAAVSVVVNEGILRFRELLEWGGNFDKNAEGDIASTYEGGHTEPRVFHANGDSTGMEIVRVLLDKARASAAVDICEHHCAVELLTDETGRCVGALVQTPRGGLQAFFARAVFVCTGGAGLLFRESTNPEVATGDGLSMMYRAGAVLQDMEFMQFHPTAIYIAGAPRKLITEAARGEGALLINSRGHRFMPDYHPRAELAPRDVVAVAILREMKQTHAVCVYLDMRRLGPKRLHERFPGIVQLCSQYDIDPVADLIPVRPAAHYMIGGAQCDLHGLTVVPGLYVAGEAAATGLHGANRLGSNSLLEGLVFGYRAACHAAGHLTGQGVQPRVAYFDKERKLHEGFVQLNDLTNSVKSLMWRQVGLEREGIELRDALDTLDHWSSYVFKLVFQNIEGWRLQGMLTTARMIVSAALQREETRGCHQRIDFPEADDARWKRHITFKRRV